MRPGGGPRYRPRPGGTAGLPVFPVTPEMLAGIAQAIAGGVTDVSYGDRSISFMSLDDLMRAYDWLLMQLGAPVATPVRRGACFSKGLDTGYGRWGVEHQEIRDALWSRDVPRTPGQVPDVDWEQR